LGQPVALVCTSGTAAANFLPAVVEACLTRVPLVVLTADRPHELRDVGAAQTIDQVRLYGSHVKWFVDMALPEATTPMLRYARAVASRAVALARDVPAGPVHVNFPLREPLVPLPGPRPAAADSAPAAWGGRPTPRWPRARGPWPRRRWARWRRSWPRPAGSFWSVVLTPPPVLWAPSRPWPGGWAARCWRIRCRGSARRPWPRRRRSSTPTTCSCGMNRRWRPWRRTSSCVSARCRFRNRCFYIWNVTRSAASGWWIPGPSGGTRSWRPAA